MDEEEDGEDDIEEFQKLVKQSEHAWEPAREELELINVTEHDKKELKIGMLITTGMRSELVALLREYVDIFA
jgi:septum formation topological specificity factor MinE